MGEAMIASQPNRPEPEFAGSLVTFHVNVRWLGAVEA
jgi:hypothetical protein